MQIHSLKLFLQKNVIEMNLLLISNSTMAGEPYLEYSKHEIAKFVEGRQNIVFIPYAAVAFSFDDYEAKVNRRFKDFGSRVMSIHRFENPLEAVNNADAIVVGGGNTWNLVRQLHLNGLMEPIRNRVLDGIPYIGWSAGSNVACPTMQTTNDMPVVDPLGFDTFGFVPFQINPHYTDKRIEGHGGETREERIIEYLAANPKSTVVGLREGCMLKIVGSHIEYIGKQNLRLFMGNREPLELEPDEDFDFLLNL